MKGESRLTYCATVAVLSVSLLGLGLWIMRHYLRKEFFSDFTFFNMLFKSFLHHNLHKMAEVEASVPGSLFDVKEEYDSMFLSM